MRRMKWELYARSEFEYSVVEPQDVDKNGAKQLGLLVSKDGAERS